MNAFVAIEAVDTKVPPAAIIGLPTALKIEDPLRFTSTIADTPDATVRVKKFT